MMMMVMSCFFFVLNELIHKRSLCSIGVAHRVQKISKPLSHPYPTTWPHWLVSPEAGMTKLN